ncbi:MAG TPA: AAA family ATPase [Opitutales bacterium]|nr:AAA family ATPase [Opitutales bacterium]
MANYKELLKKGFIVLTGEVGCGKTTVCRQLLTELDPKKYDTALILNPRLTETQLLQAILTELGEKKLGRTRVDMTTRLNKLLLERNAAGRDVVLIVDESQNLSFDTIEHLRLLSNLETDTQKLLQIILIGQPELKDMLRQDRLRQLRQRVQVFFDMRPLTPEETSSYIRHRISAAGSGGRPTFTDRACSSIHRASRGIPREINKLCDKALLSAFARNGDSVNWWDVRRAKKESRL